MKENSRVSIEYTSRTRQRMALARFRPEIRSIVAPTISMAASRCGEGAGAAGWIDMKFDPADGSERDEASPLASPFYRKDRIYGWIQGRALESFSAHLRWGQTLRGFDVFDRETALSAAERLYRTIMTRCFPPGRQAPSASFVMDPEGAPLGREFAPGATTLTHLFVLRGLLAYASYRGYGDDADRAAGALRIAVDAALRGECLDDQMKFEERGGEAYDVSRKGYEGQMIAIGACELLYAHSRAREDVERGARCIGSVLDNFVLRGKDGQPFIIDALDAEGQALRDDGRITVNPGHAIEFAGLALQFFRHVSAAGMDIPDACGMTETLAEVAERCNRWGRAPHGGIVRSIDAETLQVLNGACPWWSSFEAARTFGELYIVSRDDAERERRLANAESYLSCVRKVYLAPSSIGVPVQTVSIEGAVVPIIPATPDIDAGYHTGIPLLDLYEIASLDGALLCGAGERRLPERLGTRLQGHIARTEPADREHDPLRARCVWLESAEERVLFFSADVLEFSAEWTDAFTKSISERFGVRPGSLFLMATHTHTAPAVIDLGQLRADRAFLDELAQALGGAAEDACANLEPSVVLSGDSEAKGIGVNRRAVDEKTGAVVMRPNPEGDIDEDVPLVFIFGAGGSLKSVIFNVSVHPTTLGVSFHEVSADYPGRAAALVRESLGGDVVAIPVQGACGDIRPKVLDSRGREFAEGGPADVERMGAAVAAAVRRALDEALARARGSSAMRGAFDLAVGAGRLVVETREAELPFAYSPSLENIKAVESASEDEMARLKTERARSTVSGRADAAQADVARAGFAASHENPLLAAETFRDWAAAIAGSDFDARGAYSGPKGQRARFSLCLLGNELAFLSIPGEAFCAIGKALKRLASPRSAIVCGYCGGTIGYIPTEKAYAQGGYEVETAFRYYGQPAPLSPRAEKIIVSLFKDMLEEETRCRS